jgi:hypothetical protein
VIITYKLSVRDDFADKVTTDAMGDGWGSASELELNSKMFCNCVEATLSVAKLDRLNLQLGAKWHVRDPMPVAPFRESDVPPNVSSLPGKSLLAAPSNLPI